MHPYAQTNLQLLQQLREIGYSPEDIRLVHRAYGLAQTLFTAYFRGNGKPFLSHLVGTASILATLNVSIPIIIAGLLHAVYMSGNFGDERAGITSAKRSQLIEVVGNEVEILVSQYTKLQWNRQQISNLSPTLEQLSPVERDVLLIRLANELEDHLDDGILYCAHADKRRQYLRDCGSMMVQMATDLDYGELAIALQQTFSHVLSVNVDQELCHHQNDSFLLLPRSTQHRSEVVLHRKLMEFKQGIRSRVGRLKQVIAHS